MEKEMKQKMLNDLDAIVDYANVLEKQFLIDKVMSVKKGIDQILAENKRLKRNGWGDKL